MTTYQSKPTTVQAVQIPDKSWPTIESVLEGAFGLNAAHLTLTGSGDVVMVTIQGREITASPGEYIIQEQDDPTRFYPCSADVFQTKYAPAVTHPMAELPMIFGTTRENRGLGTIALSGPEVIAVADVIAAHESELVAALEPFGVDWRTVCMPEWERALTAPEVRAALAAYERNGL